MQFQDLYAVIKAVHIVFVVSYFAGLFYIVRLIIYHSDTQKEVEPERVIMRKQYRFMESRLWNIITVPAGLIVILTGATLLTINPLWLTQGWMHVKLLFVFFLIIYHFWTLRTLREVQKDIYRYTSVQLRMFNEVATLILFVIVFAVVLKSEFMANWYWVLISFFLMGALIMLVVKLVNRKK